MDAEIQRRRTFEVIAKWWANESGITIEFLPDCVPHADPKNKVIRLPKNIKIENLDKVLALVFHESGHILKSHFDVKKVVSNQNEMAVLNACEDIRIDNHNMSYLPKIYEFYEELVKWEEANAMDMSKIPLEHKILCDLIRMGTGWGQYTTKDKQSERFIVDNDLQRDVRRITELLDYIEQQGFKDHYDLKHRVEDLTEKIFGKQKKQKQQDEPGKGGGNGQGKNKGTGTPGKTEDCSGGGDGKGGGKEEPNIDGEEGDDGEKKQEKQKAGGGGLGSGKHAGLFEPDPNAKYSIDEVSLGEQTVQSFTELLKVKSVRTIHEGTTLDTDNLTAFFTGDIDSLFKEVKTEKIKRSRIILLLDSSGSMHSSNGLADSVNKNDLLLGVTKRIIRILDSVREIEGINVDYDVRAFDTRYIKLPKTGWEQEYRCRNGGGTDCDTAFAQAQEEIIKDTTIDGNKMILLLTDGQVDRRQIERIKKCILVHNSDVKCLILGIGLSREFEKILGGRNIISSQLADGEILQAIEDMLES